MCFSRWPNSCQAAGGEAWRLRIALLSLRRGEVLLAEDFAHRQCRANDARKLIGVDMLARRSGFLANTQQRIDQCALPLRAAAQRTCRPRRPSQRPGGQNNKI